MHSLAFFLLVLVSCATSTSASPLLQQNTKRTTGLSPTYELGTAAGVSGQNALYDYVIVGGGTAGLTIAARLAEDASITVAVIEAGGFYELDNPNISVIPGEVSYFSGTSPEDTNPKIDWGFITEPQAVGISDCRLLGCSWRHRSRAQMNAACTMPEARLWVVAPPGISLSIIGRIKPEWVGLE